MCQKSLIIIGNNYFWVFVFNFCHFSPKKGENNISRSEFQSCQRQKCYRNPFSGQFEPLKEYGRHCHRYSGKVIFLGSIGSQKCAKNAIFKAFKAPHPHVGLTFDRM